MTYNEEQFIEECLKHHMPYLDETIVLDEGSTDKTVEISESLGADVHVKPIKYPSDRRNYMQDLARNKWCLHIDADELFEVSFMEKAPLMIQRAPNRNIVYISRFNLPFGKNWPDRQARLLNKERIYWYRKIHEITGAIGEREPFDKKYAEEVVIIKTPTILHRVNDRDPKHRVERLREWKKILINNKDDFPNVEWEIRHLDQEIKECEERFGQKT